MSLLSRSLKALALILPLLLGIWALVFYLVIIDEVRESVDDGLDDQAELLEYRAERDSTVLLVRDLGLHGYAITPLDNAQGKGPRKSFRDTTLFIPAEGEMETVRLFSTHFKLDGQRYALQVYTSTVEEDDLVESLLSALLVLYAVLLLTVLLVNHALLRRVWRPFHNILHQMKNFRLGTGERLPDVPTDVREFKELKAAVNILVGHAAETYKNQRSFTENAAHELQTPLAIAINKLELLAEHEGSEEQRMQSIGEVIASLERLTRMNRSLLLLARIENKQFPDEQPVALGDVCRKVVEEFTDLAHHRDVQVEVSVSSDIERRMEPGLARILINNLIKNAIVHNVPGGRVWVEVSREQVLFRNTGKAKPLDGDRVFDRFRKETTADAGTGLGLAIAKAIATSYGFTLAYAYAGEHRMTLRF
ncbi:MAG: HAMP domain-containing histidine kinase [Flavobacteriales bacterium]|jgi:signal transduction histidine kinase|nr:HAMP domain-containing histidine kinase [Flavobacteriales bacterium]MCB0757251.1 HAMP domain-containing histidine kinase [Flavobacteriales bacterium]